MKYIGVDKNGSVFAYKGKPKWDTDLEWWRIFDTTHRLIPAEILPPLEPCCLYKITKDAYVLIEDRRKK